MNQPASAYFLDERKDPNETHTLSVLVQNEPGVLARVIGLFSGRGYNIDSLTVSETEQAKHMSRITIVTTGTPMVIQQIKHQLDRMIPVYRVVDMTTSGRSIERELAMVKVRSMGESRIEALRLAEAFRARVIDATTESFVFEITGASNKIDQFVMLMVPLGLVEVSRTGVAAIARGPRECETGGAGSALMKPSDLGLAIGVAIAWGLGFVATRLVLDEISPALMTALRFAIASLPCFFVRRPDVPWPTLIAISATLFFGQFLAQSWGIAHGVPPGLASVIVQSQALFTVAFAALVFREKPTRAQVIGIGVAVVGLLMICGTVGFDFTVGAFAVMMISPLSFATGNLLLRRARDVPMFDLFSWLCLIPVAPLLLIALATEGSRATWTSLVGMSPVAIVSILLIGVVATCIAYGIWGRLLRDYTAAQVVPFALLVPFIGAGASAVVFGETFGTLRLAGMLTVVLGIAIMVLFGRARTLPEIG